jgi:hypothetical protein
MYTFLQLRTSSDRLTELCQIFSPNPQDTTIAHGWQLPAPNPVLNGTRRDFQQLSYLLGRVDAAYLGGLWQNRRFLFGWHTQIGLLMVVSLGPTSVNLTEEFCTQETPSKIPQNPKLRQ